MTATIEAPRRETKRLHVITWGCQMNVYDSARMADVLAPLGYAPSPTPEGADIVILNTCHIRERATEKVFSELGRLRKLKDEGGGRMLLAVAGCVAQAEGALIRERAPFVDVVVGPQAYHRLPELVAQASRAGGVALDTDFPAVPKFDHLPEAAAPSGPIAFLTIQEGCDRFCSFCVVPYTRGAEYSRPAAAVLAEARRLVAGGAREIALLGQNVNAWHGEGPDGRAWSLARLIREMAGIQDLVRIRYTTSHPGDMDDDLIAAHGEVPALMPFLHLPVQSGSDHMLRVMNRRHDRDLFLGLADRLRAARPDLALSSDFIAGHPGETEADHAATLDLIGRVGFAQAFSFKYSPRPGTPAAGAPNQVPEATKDRRLAEIQALLRAQQSDFNRRCVGLTVDLLVTGPGRHPGQMAGRSPWIQPVHFPGGGARAGDVVSARILAAHPNSLAATLDKERVCA